MSQNVCVCSFPIMDIFDIHSLTPLMCTLSIFDIFDIALIFCTVFNEFNAMFLNTSNIKQCALTHIDVTGSASASACAVVHYRLITYATYMRVQAPHVHPGTAAVNQTACNFPIKGRAFAIALHSKPEKPTVNISNRNYKISKTVCSILDPRKALTFHYKF